MRLKQWRMLKCRENRKLPQLTERFNLNGHNNHSHCERRQCEIEFKRRVEASNVARHDGILKIHFSFSLSRLCSYAMRLNLILLVRHECTFFFSATRSTIFSFFFIRRYRMKTTLKW